ncbi:MmcQ/YjbR family DNA-binding protein [Kineosporia sp. J2-2]|uniref:MmcQ/YjbR family DNA-binding protein n=1 Tax=Kineosporia corallincola TaxID=2835133 RepID=A0ABS5TEZ7_9ACTN|nr:MmcQ/YjbR family DNA-binding protein [Kineosporia corallincola]MBT0769651.1 MmcQ/YjbR family DNA-binding protein [Kineosporia corallincola]
MDEIEVRAIALGLPETREQPHFSMTSFRVRGSIFATLTPERDQLHVFVPEDHVHDAVSEAPDTCEELWWGQKLDGVKVTLAGTDPTVVNELLISAWRQKAPKKLVAEWEGQNA